MKVIPPSDHHIDPNLISEGALRVVQQLKRDGFQAFVVGGAVRDLILGGAPKDYDVATDATPEQVHQRFKSARIIGRRFQIVHVRHGREIIEVTTFRGHHENDTGSQKSRQSDKGLLLRDNVYGTLEEDAARRDLTINALYYDPDDRSVLDQMGGLEDIAARMVRVIGEPHQRYREDPVRMLRVVRFAARLQFDIESETGAAIADCAPLLTEVPAARLFDEFLKLFMAGHATPTFAMLCREELLQYLFPEPAWHIAGSESYTQFVTAAMRGTDQRVQDGRPVTPAFLLAAMLWPAVAEHFRALTKAGDPPAQAMHAAGQQVVAAVCLHTAIPKRFSLPMREIWDLQVKLERRQARRVKELLANRRFRAAYDLLLLREAAGAELDDCGEFWTEQQRLFPELVGSAAPEPLPEKRRRPRRRRR